MISYLKGTILNKNGQYLIVFVGGTGYKVIPTPELLETAIGSEVEAYIYHKVSDDSQTLFGMKTFAELQFFELLISVSGVGPKVGLNIISSTKLDVLEQSIINGDTEIFTRVSGVGKKTAERIILELKSKLSSGILASSSGLKSDLYDALVSLGYNPREIREIITQIPTDLSEPEQIKQALKLLSKK